jgi:hypothetical protein
VTGDLALVNNAGAPGVLHAGLDNAGMAINGVIHEGATLDKIGAATCRFSRPATQSATSAYQTARWCLRQAAPWAPQRLRWTAARWP